MYDVVLICGAYLSTPADPRWNPHCDIVQPHGIVDTLDIVLMAGYYDEGYEP